MGRRPELPWPARAILSALVPFEFREQIHGDMTERFHAVRDERGRRAGRRWLRAQLLSLDPIGLWRCRRDAPPSPHQPQRGRSLMDRGWGGDVRQAIRAIRSRRATSLTVVLTFALAVGTTTAVYSVVDGVLLRSLAYPEPDRLARIWQTKASWVDSPVEALRSIANQLEPNAPIYYEWLDQPTGFRSLGAYVDASFVLQRSDGAEVVRGQEATSGWFETLGVDPILGRALQADDDAEGAPLVVVLSEGAWRTRYGGRADVLGVDIDLDGRPHTVVGVMPAGFSAPPQDETGVGMMLPGGGALLWTPLTDEARSGSKSVYVIGRLEPGLTLEAAADRFASVQSALAAAGRDRRGDEMGVRVTGLLDSVVAGVRSTLWFLLGAVGLVLVVATANIANILTAVGLGRRREFAVRAALGARPLRLARALFVENALLAALGGLGGVVLAWLALPALLRFLPSTVPRVESIGMSPTVLLCGIAVTGVTTLLVGTLPALLAGRADPQDSLKTSARGQTWGRAAVRMRSLLVVGEVTLAFVLLIGAGLLSSSFARLQAVDRGFPTEGLVGMWVEPDRETFPTWTDQDRFRRALLERFEAIPGVAATATNHLPLSGLSSGTPFYVDRGSTAPEEGNAVLSVGLENYMSVMGLPLTRGRGFESGDSRDAPRVAIVNETMAQRYWPGEEAVGQRLRGLDDSTVVAVVGVAADARHGGLTIAVQPEVYLAASQSERTTNEWVLRIRGELAPTIQQARAAVTALSPTTAVTRVFVLEDKIAESVAIPRFRAFLVVGLAGIAALLALLGVYGILAYAVSQRTSEIGVRMALGARSSDVVKQVVGAGLKLTVVGIVVGLVLAWRGTPLLQHFLFEIAPNDLSTYLSIVVGLLLVSGVAAYLPARRAAGVDPMSVLRGD